MSCKVSRDAGIGDWLAGRTTQADWAYEQACQIVADVMSEARPMVSASKVAARLRVVREGGFLDGVKASQKVLTDAFEEAIHVA